MLFVHSQNAKNDSILGMSQVFVVHGPLRPLFRTESYLPTPNSMLAKPEIIARESRFKRNEGTYPNIHIGLVAPSMPLLLIAERVHSWWTIISPSISRMSQDRSLVEHPLLPSRARASGAVNFVHLIRFGILRMNMSARGIYRCPVALRFDGWAHRVVGVSHTWPCHV